MIETNHHFASALGALYAELDETEKAKMYFEKAMRITNSEVEKKLLLNKIRKLKNNGKW